MPAKSCKSNVSIELKLRCEETYNIALVIHAGKVNAVRILVRGRGSDRRGSSLRGGGRGVRRLWCRGRILCVLVEALSVDRGDRGRGRRWLRLLSCVRRRRGPGSLVGLLLRRGLKRVSDSSYAPTVKRKHTLALFFVSFFLGAALFPCCGVGGAAVLWAGEDGCVRPVAALPVVAGACGGGIDLCCGVP